MKKPICSHLLALVLLASTAQGYSAEPRKALYRVKQAPIMESNCHLQAQSLAKRFSELTGVAAVGKCDSIKAEGYDLSIVYERKEGLELASTEADLDFPSRGHIFSSKEKCQAQLGSETTFFKEVTGIEPLVSFCRSRETYWGQKQWALIIEGFGNSKIAPQWAGSRFAGKPSPSLVTQIETDIKKHFAQSNTPVRLASLQEDEHGALRLNLMYYGKYGEQIVGSVLASLETHEQCSEMLGDLAGVNNLNESRKALGYCVTNPYDRSVDLVGVVDVLGWYSSRFSVEEFSSFQHCQTEKSQLLDFYKKLEGYKIVSGFCTQWSDKWKIHLLEEPSK